MNKKIFLFKFFSNSSVRPLSLIMYSFPLSLSKACTGFSFFFSGNKKISSYYLIMVKSLKSRNNGMACHCFLFSALGHPFLEIEQICSFFLLEGFALLCNNLLHDRIYSVCPTTCGIMMFLFFLLIHYLCTI